MRLFVALELPVAVRLAAEVRIAAERPRLPRARWAHADNLHLTLVFLGEVDDERLGALSRALSAAFASHSPLTLSLEGAGTFPPPAAGGRGKPVRVAWMGITVREGAERLLAVRRDADAAARSVLDLAAERRAWAPHLTVARPKAPWRGDAVERFVAAFASPLGEPFRVAGGRSGAQRARRGADGGPRYTTVTELPLEAAARRRRRRGW